MKPKSFNRTFMELKYASPAETAAQTNGFNRTFMELKYENNIVCDEEREF